MRRVVTLLLCISVALVVFAGKAKINAEDRLENTAKLGPERGQFIIGYKQGITASPARSRLDEAREAARHWPAELQNCVTVLNEVPALAISLVELSPACNIEEVAQAMSKDDVEYVEPNRRLYLLERNISATIVPLSLAANDPFFSQQWALARISAPDGWSVFPGSFSAPSGTPIAVVDTGVDSSHPDLAQKIIRARPIVQNSSPLVDEVGHGTAVASLALAAANNGFGIAGLAFNSPLVPVKVSVDGSASTFDLAEGLRYAADPAGGGARVINVSFGSDEPSPTISRAIEFARANGALVIAAAGNCGSGESAACSTINANRWPAAFATALTM